MKSASEVLEQGKALLANLNFQPKSAKPTVDIADFTRRYMEPPRSHKCFNVLAPPDYVWQDVISQWWLPDCSTFDLTVDYETQVIHGHPVGQVCQNRDLCHIMGWQPVGNEHLWFLKEWEKFGYAKEEQKGDPG